MQIKRDQIILTIRQKRNALRSYEKKYWENEGVVCCVGTILFEDTNAVSIK